MNPDRGPRRGPPASRRGWLPLAAAVVLSVHAGLLAWSAAQHTPSWDEIGHLASGITHWRWWRFEGYRVNPPLIRMLASLPAVLAGPQPSSEMNARWDDGMRRSASDSIMRVEWQLGRDFIHTHGDEALFWFTAGRWACIPLSLLGGYFCLRWANELYGAAAGLLALLMWCFSPNILAYAEMLTPDAGAAALGLIASYCYWRWLRNPAWGTMLAAGGTLGLAELAKTTWLVLFVLWPVLWLAHRATRNEDASRSPGGHRPLAMELGVILLIGVYGINVGYGFDGSFTPLGEYAFLSSALNGESQQPAVGNRFRDTWLGRVPVPLPKDYVLGIDLQKHEFEQGMWSYLRGEWRQGGWWYYYLYALAVKGSLGGWGLVLLALAATLRRSFRRPWFDEVFLLAPAATVLVLVSSQTGFNHHVRYALPILPFVFVWTGKIAQVFGRVHRRVAWITAAATVWMVLGSLWTYPHNHSHFNELAGGPHHGASHLLDSNVDWGQDLRYLRDWMAANPEATPLGLAYSLPQWLIDPRDVGVLCAEVPRDPAHTPECDCGPRPGWYAVFVRELWERHGDYAYFRHLRPEATLGYTAYIYHITPEQADAQREALGLARLSSAPAPMPLLPKAR